jgi:hypothetical protein
MVNWYLDTVWAVASSRYVKWFVIGYTAQSAKQRFYGYQARGFDSVVILADRLTKAQALDLEERLQSACKQSAARGGPYKRKYHPEFRSLSYYRSSGQGSTDPFAAIHSVYMAWVQP